MEPSSGTDTTFHNHYFNDPTLSDLTIRLSDRTVHVHRIVLCRRSAYFEKLILGGFKETGLKEIELHDDDPDAMMALFRCIYDLPCDEPSRLKACLTTLEFLAEICVVAEKYQVSGVQANIAEKLEDILWWKTEHDINMNSHGGRKPQPKADDFLTATRIVFNGTSMQDNVCRATLVKFCVLCIRDLNKIPGFAKLLGECGELGAAIIANKNLSIALEGSWGCDEIRYRRAIPRCSNCRETFSMSYIHEHRGESE